MREIKFRGMDVKGKWHYGNLAVLALSPYHGVEPGSYISNSAGMPFAYQVRPETIGQFIGTKNIANKEIYEGDIVKHGGVVKWYDCLYYDGGGGQHPGFYCTGYGYCTEDNESELDYHDDLNDGVEIIGNIHENPELLK